MRFAPSRRIPRPPVHPARLNPTPETMWTNLGHWPGAATYIDAAQALALRVGRAARLKPGDVVLDYACGYGDSLKLWIEKFGAARVIGVEPDPAVTAIVQRRLREWGLADRITVLTARAEEVLPDALEPRPHAVVCVDAVYHIPRKCEWLAQVVQALPAGGRMGFSDLVFSANSADSLVMRTLAGLMGIPVENLRTCTNAYTVSAQVTERALAVDRAGEAVLDSFARRSMRDGVALMLTRTAIRAARRWAGAEYVIVGVAPCHDPVITG